MITPIPYHSYYVSCKDSAVIATYYSQSAQLVRRGEYGYYRTKPGPCGVRCSFYGTSLKYANSFIGMGIP